MGVGKGKREDELDFGAAEELGAWEEGAVVTCAGEVDRGWVLDADQEGQGDDVDGGVCVGCQRELSEWHGSVITLAVGSKTLLAANAVDGVLT